MDFPTARLSLASSLATALFGIPGALPGVFKLPMFWCLYLLHVLLFGLVRGLKCQRSSDAIKLNLKCLDAKESFLMVPLDIANLGLLNGLTSFFIVFYAGNCFARYTGTPEL
ncbi:hypothetical protein T484DRAFT_1891693 [Baffinella frigidus]|nr:hypothetical protein T484DRAFT_1891693 [Cryptophyta sp. CCMP2293]